jgi:hypothetical protein
MNKFCWIIAALLFCSAATRAAETNNDPDKKAAGPAVESKIGIEGVYFLRYEREGLIPLPATERSPIILRIANVARDKNTFLYEIRYIGTRPGEYDLRKYLARIDGNPLENIPPLKVAVHEVLPKDHDGAIEPLAAPGSYWAWPYRTLLQGGLIVWGMATGVYLVRRFLRQRPQRTAPTAAAPTLADQLLPLVEAALAGTLSSTQQARLEMLLLAHWRQRLQLTNLAPDKALRQMRQHDSAGKLLRELESWLHARPGTREVDVAALLSPYRTAAAIDLDSPRLEVAAV